MRKVDKPVFDWLLGWDNGLSSTAIAHATLGYVPEKPAYPHDPSDFGRCYRLLKAVPHTRRGLRRLGKEGGPVWAALYANWKRIERSYLRQINVERAGGKKMADHQCYELMRSIIDPLVRQK